MNETKQFIEDAVNGGWRTYPSLALGKMKLDKSGLFYTAGTVSKTVHEILLDPLAWKAVGRTNGWSSFSTHEHSTYEPCNGFCTEYLKQTGWKAYWHRFIDHLADGKSIEEALSAIKKDALDAQPYLQGVADGISQKTQN